MSVAEAHRAGTICWRDLTVKNAQEVRDFYQQVVGWKWSVQDGDFNMLIPATGDAAAGICWARGANADLPPQWLIYIAVDDVDASAAKCVELGGQILVGPRPLGGGRFCVIRDPGGAVCALYHPSPSEPSTAAGSSANSARDELGDPVD